MKILILGAGIIGSTYAWQLNKAGYNVTLFDLPSKVNLIKKEGFKFTCLDLRKKKNQLVSETFSPKIIDQIGKDDFYDYILVTTNTDKLRSVLDILSKIKNESTIVFCQNFWEDISLIDHYIDPDRYFFAFPFKVGGGTGKSPNEIQSIIFNAPLNGTILGEKNGFITDRVKKLAQVFRDANMTPKISRQMINWLWTHYVWAASNLGAFLKARSFDNFVQQKKYLKECYLAMREGFELCRLRGVEPKAVKINRLYYLPLFILIPLTAKMYKTPGMEEMFEGHIRNAPLEMKGMYYDIIKTAESLSFKMPYFEGFQESIELLDSY